LALRLELRSGELVLWEGRVHRLQSLEGVRARIQETGAADLREVLVTELRGLPSLPIVQLDQRLEKLRVADTPDWTKAQEREAIRIHRLVDSGHVGSPLRARGGSVHRARGSYQSESEAKLTLAELNEWLYLEIAGQFHHTIHRMVGTTPAAAWVTKSGSRIRPAL
jgi:hypothetical protein